MKNKKISPLKKKPLRYPGQSCDEEIDKMIFDKAIPLIALLFVYGFLCIYAWLDYIFDLNELLFAVLFTIITVIVFIYFLITLIKTRQKAKNYQLGRDGEKIVGQHLESIRGGNARIFHDIQKDYLNNDSNIDHIIVSVKGIFVIETKTFSQRKNSSNKIVFDGVSIIVNNYEYDKNYVNQVNASIKWLSKKLEEMTGKYYKIKGVLVFPNWYVETTLEGKKSDIWALNLDGLIKYLENEPRKMNYEELSLVANMIETYSRNRVSK